MRNPAPAILVPSLKADPRQHKHLGTVCRIAKDGHTASPISPWWRHNTLLGHPLISFSDRKHSAWKVFLFPQYLLHASLAAHLLHMNSPAHSCRCAPLARSRISTSARPGKALGWDSGPFCRQKSRATVPGTVVCVLAYELFGQSSGLSTLLTAFGQRKDEI